MVLFNEMSESNSKQEKPSEKLCLSLVNHLINEAIKSLPEVKSIPDIDCNLIVSLYQNITGNVVPDLLVCKDKEGEAHNVQAVIDALSLDALGISLSHITGEEIVAGNLNSIFNLLQVLEGVWLYLPVQENGQRILKRKISKIQKNSINDFNKSSSASADETNFRRTEEFSNEDKKSFKPTVKENGNIVDEQTYPSIKRKVAKLPHTKNRETETKLDEKIENLYSEHLNIKLKALVEKNSSVKSRSSQMKKTHLQIMKKPLKKSPLPPCHKSFLLPYSLRHRSRPLTSSKPTNSRNPNYVSYRILANSKKDKLEYLIPQKQAPRNFIEVLSSEFPGIHMPSKTWQQVKEEYELHLLKMQNRIKTCLLQKSKATIQAEDVAKNQEIRSNIAKKEAQKQQYLEELKEQKNHENKMKYRLRDSRLKAAKMKQYYDEFHEEMRKKMQRPSSSKEILFKQVFKEIVNIQKYHVDTLCKEKKEAEEEDAKNYLNYLTSLENLYQSQFSMLSELLTNERKDMRIKMDAEKQMIDKMHRDFQEVLKQEIRFMQKTVVELVDDQHFLELDAEQFIERIREQHRKY